MGGPPPYLADRRFARAGGRAPHTPQYERHLPLVPGHVPVAPEFAPLLGEAAGGREAEPLVQGDGSRVGEGDAGVGAVDVLLLEGGEQLPIEAGAPPPPPPPHS